MLRVHPRQSMNQLKTFNKWSVWEYTISGLPGIMAINPPMLVPQMRSKKFKVEEK
jgi:hypothetical protein